MRRQQDAAVGGRAILRQREGFAAPAPLAGTIEIVTRASALDYSDSWSGFKLTPSG